MSESLLFEIWAIAKWDMSGFDEWLGDASHWVGREHLRQGLAEQRAELVHVFQTNYSRQKSAS